MSRALIYKFATVAAAGSPAHRTLIGQHCQALTFYAGFDRQPAQQLVPDEKLALNHVFDE